MNIIKIEEKDTFHNVIGYKQKPSVSFFSPYISRKFCNSKIDTMRKKHFLFASVLALLCGSSTLHAQDFKLTSSGYFKNQGVDVMAFDDIYPEDTKEGYVSS